MKSSTTEFTTKYPEEGYLPVSSCWSTKGSTMLKKTATVRSTTSGIVNELLADDLPEVKTEKCGRRWKTVKRKTVKRVSEKKWWVEKKQWKERKKKEKKEKTQPPGHNHT